MIVTVGDTSPREEDSGTHRGQLCCVNGNISEGRIERVEMSLKSGFHMIVTVIVSICRRPLRSYGNQALDVKTLFGKVTYPLDWYICL